MTLLSGAFFLGWIFSDGSDPNKTPAPAQLVIAPQLSETLLLIETETKIPNITAEVDNTSPIKSITPTAAPVAEVKSLFLNLEDQ